MQCVAFERARVRHNFVGGRNLAVVRRALPPVDAFGEIEQRVLHDFRFVMRNKGVAFGPFVFIAQQQRPPHRRVQCNEVAAVLQELVNRPHRIERKARRVAQQQEIGLRTLQLSVPCQRFQARHLRTISRVANAFQRALPQCAARRFTNHQRLRSGIGVDRRDCSHGQTKKKNTATTRARSRVMIGVRYA